MSTPSLRPTRGKHDDLYRDRLPDGPFEMNARVRTGNPRIRTVDTLRTLILPAVGGTLFALFFSKFGIWFWSLQVLGGLLIIGVGLAVFQLMSYRQPLQSLDVPLSKSEEVFAGLVGPLGLWLLVAAMPLTRSVLFSFLVLIPLALLLTAFVADGVTGHYAHNLATNSRIDVATVTRWLGRWRQRFRGMRDRAPRFSNLTPQQRRTHQHCLALLDSYRYGFLWLFASLPLALVLLFCGFIPTGIVVSPGLALVLAVIAVVLLRALWQLIRFPESPYLFGRSIWSWCTYDTGDRQPGWVFQSPGGRQGTREGAVVLAVFVMTLALVPTARCFPVTMLWADVAVWMPPDQYGLPLDEAESHLRESMSGSNAGWMLEGFSGAFRGDPRFLVTLLSAGVCCSLVPPLVFLAASFSIAAPVLVAYYTALEAPNAYEQDRSLTRDEGLAQRRSESPHPDEKNSVQIGRHASAGYPILLPQSLLLEHVWILGGPGSGKTSLGLIPLITQRIGDRLSALAIFDGKGDMGLFHTVRLEALKAGRTFKWFTTEPNWSTFAFNPFGKHLDGLNLSRVVNFFLQSLNQMHGSDYARGFFTMVGRTLLAAALAFDFVRELAQATGRRRQQIAALCAALPQGIQSFDDLRLVMAFLAQDRETYQKADHLLMLIQMLCELPQLMLKPDAHNAGPAGPAGPAGHAIQMRDVLEQGQVVYFYLPGAPDAAIVGELMRLGLYSVFEAARTHKHRHGRAARVDCFIDEAQYVVSKNFANVLEQGRSFGMACYLSHHSPSQLAPAGGEDLSQLVQESTVTKLFFSIRNLKHKQEISENSGEATYADLSYTTSQSRIDRGTPAPVSHGEPFTRITVHERPGPRLTLQEINDINTHPNRALLTVERGTGLSQYCGTIPVHIDWPMPKAEYERRERLPWPNADARTLIVPSGWRHVPAQPPPPPPPPQRSAAPPVTPAGPVADVNPQELLERLKRRLKD